MPTILYYNSVGQEQGEVLESVFSILIAASPYESHMQKDLGNTNLVRKKNARRQIAEKRIEVKGKGERERYTQLNAEFQRIERRNKKAFLSKQCKEIEENNGIIKTRDLFINQRYQGNISYKDGHNKGQKQYGPNRNRKY